LKQILGSLGRAALASVVMISLAGTSQASVVATETNRVTWAGSLTTVVTQDFNEAITGPFAPVAQTYNTSGGYPSGVLTFLGEFGTTPSYQLKRLDEGGEIRLVGPVWDVAVNDPRLVVLLSNAATAFGIDIGSSVAGITYQFKVVQVSGTDFVTMPAAAPVSPSMSFFGVHTDSPILRIEIRMFSGQVDGGFDPEESRFDNAATGFFLAGDPEPSETPEPSTIIFLTTGMSALAWTRYRRNRSQHS
jgi:hypothetical protein